MFTSIELIIYYTQVRIAHRGDKPSKESQIRIALRSKRRRESIKLFFFFFFDYSLLFTLGLSRLPIWLSLIFPPVLQDGVFSSLLSNGWLNPTGFSSLSRDEHETRSPHRKRIPCTRLRQNWDSCGFQWDSRQDESRPVKMSFCHFGMFGLHVTAMKPDAQFL